MPHDDFLAAIREAPADPHARLVYADWLEERGDPRSEYLRTEHELARTSPFVARYWELKQRRDELRRGCEPDWLEGVGYPTYYTPLFTTVPEDRDECWRRVDRFIDFWHATPLDRTSGNTEEEIRAAENRLGTPLPAALREWYRLAGRRTEIWSNQGRWLELDKIADSNPREYLVFRAEILRSAPCGVRRTDFEVADPPVYRIREQYQIDGESVTRFALQQLVLESVWKAPIFAQCENGAAIEKWIHMNYRWANLPRTFGLFDTISVYEGRDTLFVDSLPAEGYPCAAVRDESVWEQLPDSVRNRMVRWDSIDNRGR